MRFDIERNETGTTEVLDLQTAKDHLRVSFSEEDAMIQRMIKTARRWCEQYTQRILFDSTMTVQFYHLHGVCEFPLPFEKVDSITSVIRIQSNGVEVPLTEGRNYRILGLTRKIISTNQFFDSGAFGMDYQMRVTYETVYDGMDREDFEDAMLKIVGDMYRNRENTETENAGGATSGPAYIAARDILDPLRRKTWL